MKLIIEIFTGKLFYIKVGEDATLADLKTEIEAQEKFPCDRIILILHTNLMNENEVSLVDYGVQDGSHIYLFFYPLNDGAPHHHLFLKENSVFSLAQLPCLSSSQTR